MVTTNTDPKPYDLFSATCPTRDALELIADKWSVLVILLLKDTPWRFGKMRRAIGGISQKMLTQTLRDLERNGLVARRVYATTPPSVEYSLTPLGRTLTDILQGLSDWAESNIEDVLAARSRFDDRGPRPPAEDDADRPL